MIRDLLLRLRSLMRRSAVDRELEDELRFHFDELVDGHLRGGLTAAQAERQARLDLGGVDQIKEEHRDARGVRAVSDLGGDLRYALRQLRRAPGFAALAVLCLGLGIDVNTSIFGAFSAVLLRPMDVIDPDNLVILTRGADTTWAYPTARDLSQRSGVLTGVTASFPMESDVEVDGETEIVASELIPAGYDRVVGVRPFVGRWFVDDREPAAVISYALWQRRFNGSANALGGRIASQSESYTIVGVAPPEFTGVLAPMRTDLWVPMLTRPSLSEQLEDRRRVWRGLTLFARLDRAGTAAQAAAELNSIDTQLAKEGGGSAEPRQPIAVDHVRGLPDVGMRRRMGMLTTLLMAVVALVLLIASVNVGNLLLVRGALRQREFAMRLAVGASGRRLLQQVLVESLVLAVCGAIVGLVLATWTNRLLQTTMPSTIASFPLQLDLSLDWRSLVFATTATLVTTVLCGLIPAWRSSRTHAVAVFRNEIRVGPGKRWPLTLVAQVVMSLVLLFLAGSVLQALGQALALGEDVDWRTRLYAYTAVRPAPSGESRRQFDALALQRLRALPGVRNAGVSSSLLSSIDSECVSLADNRMVRVATSAVDASFFGVIGATLVAGHGFSTTEPSSGSSIVVNEGLARRLWPQGAAIGEGLRIGCENPRVAVVIGVVRDAAISGFEDSRAHLYQSLSSWPPRAFAAFVVEADRPGTVTPQSLRETLLGLGEGVRVYDVASVDQHLEQRYAPVRWLSAVLSVFAMLALVLAAIGLYGVIAYRVAQRTREFGVRVALGASRPVIFREVLAYGLGIVAVGILIGEILAAALTRAAGAAMEGLAVAGIAIHVGVAVLWMAVACLACSLPAMRASRVDPVVALRHE